MIRALPLFYFFFFNDTATTEIYTLSLHDALPIFFGVWHSDEHILASNSKCLAQNPIDIGDMLEHLEYQHGVEGAVAERKRRIDIHDRQTLRFRLPQILEVDVTADTVQAVPHQNAAISPETATQIKYG